MEITMESILERQKTINIAHILRASFSTEKDINRVRTKIARGKPELTTEESESIGKGLKKLKIKFI